MENKDRTIRENMTRFGEIYSNSCSELLHKFEPLLRNAYNEGFRDGQKGSTAVAQKEELSKMYDKGVKDGAALSAMHGSDATGQELEKAYWEGAELGAQKIWEALADYITMSWVERHEILKDQDESGFEKVSSLDDLFRFYKPSEFLKLYQEHKGITFPVTNMEKFEEVFGRTICGEEMRFPAEWKNKIYESPKKQ